MLSDDAVLGQLASKDLFARAGNAATYVTHFLYSPVEVAIL
jgi:hypothetical protein